MLHQVSPPEPDCWDLPGGGLEPLEPLLLGLRREVWEETGIQDFQCDRLLTVFEQFFPDGDAPTSYERQRKAPSFQPGDISAG
jgi:8-oxo-dGTP pyrophosphatase MutT (NUDIX family)